MDHAAATLSPSLPVRLLRTAELVILAAALGAIGLLAALTLPTARDAASRLTTAGPEFSALAVTGLVATAVSILVLPLLLLVVGRRCRWLRRTHLIVLWAVVLTAAGYLVWDDTAVRAPLSLAEISPALPGDQTSFALYLRYGKDAPATKTVTTPKLLIGAATADLATKPEKWADFLRTHRAEIEAEWAKLAPVRAWWDELAALPRIGDLTAPHPAAPILAFQPTRVHAQVAVAIASLQALDGRGDEAMATVTRLYSVARKWEPNSRTLVRAMIAKVVQKMALQTAAFVLDHTPVSVAARAAFDAELTAATGGPAGARHLVLIEGGFSQPMVAEFIRGTPMGGLQPFTSLQTAVRIFGPLVINPRATLNLLGDRYRALAELAAARRLKELEDREHPVNQPFLADYAGKNLGGRLLGDMALPALAKVVKTYWDIDDLRLAMLARLRT
jgi:hypothetical protein